MAKAKTVRKIADMWLSKAKSYFYYFFYSFVHHNFSTKSQYQFDHIKYYS